MQQLKTIYNNIKSKNTDIKDLSELENLTSLNDIMGKISSQIDDLSQTGVKIFDNFKFFFNKYDKLNESTINASIPRYDTCSTSSNILANSANSKRMNYLIKNGNNANHLKSKMFNIGNNNLTLALKDTTLYSKDSTNSCKTNVKVDRSKRQFNSYNRAKYNNKKNQGMVLYSDLNLNKHKIKNEGEENDNPLYSDRYQKYPSIDRNEKRDFLPLIKKI